MFYEQEGLVKHNYKDTSVIIVSWCIDKILKYCQKLLLMYTFRNI